MPSARQSAAQRKRGESSAREPTGTPPPGRKTSARPKGKSAPKVRAAPARVVEGAENPALQNIAGLLEGLVGRLDRLEQS
eukprot:3224162-Amphidinium_carterae.1